MVRHYIRDLYTLATDFFLGVRNPSAAKNMRLMKKGDLAFFYASNGKAGRKPGIVGIMEIVEEHTEDPSTADRDHYAYVEKEADRKKWCLVHVEFRKKFDKPVHLSELQEFSKDDSVLSHMELLKQSRLSVCKIKQKEWNFINENLVQGFEQEVDSFAKTGTLAAALTAAKEALGLTGGETEEPAPNNGDLATESVAEAKSPGIFGSTIPALVGKATEAVKDAAVAAIPALEEVLPSGEVSASGASLAAVAPTSRSASRPGSRAGSAAPKRGKSAQPESAPAADVASASLATVTE